MLSRFSLFPPLSLAYVAAVTPDSWEVKIVDENFGPSNVEEADLVGITAFTSNIGRAYQLASLYREKGIPVVLGGIHASMLSEEALQYADAVVKGEVEGIWGKVVEDFEANRMGGVYQGPTFWIFPPSRCFPEGIFSIRSISGTPFKLPGGAPSTVASAPYPGTWEKRTGSELLPRCYGNWLRSLARTSSSWMTT
jgi:hypothetical protein